MTPVQKLKQEQAATPAKAKTPTLMQRVEDVCKKIVAHADIKTPADSVKLSGFLRDATLLKREIEAAYKKKREPHVKAQRDIIKEEKEFTGLLEKAEAAAAAAIKTFARIEAEARAKKEADERAKREQEAREEAQLRADQLRAAAAAAPSKAVARRLEAQAVIVETAQPIIEPVQIEAAPQLLADGQHAKKAVHGAVDDLEKLVLQVAAGIMLEKYAGKANPHVAAFLSAFNPNVMATIGVLQPSMPRIHELAKNFPQDLALAGVRVEEDESLVSRR